MRGATVSILRYGQAAEISIHAPHARSDMQRKKALPEASGISIHAPHARSDAIGKLRRCAERISIHAPHARSDSGGWSHGAARHDFNPRSSCEERLLPVPLPRLHQTFQSTLLMRGATAADKVRLGTAGISIHAPHARSDSRQGGAGERPQDFNPRSSCEERPLPTTGRRCYEHFNPRSSCEERRGVNRERRAADDFNPRSSCEERLCQF